jgi:hypothetical protein
MNHFMDCSTLNMIRLTKKLPNIFSLIHEGKTLRFPLEGVTGCLNCFCPVTYNYNLLRFFRCGPTTRSTTGLKI